jgi:hypothetical protein
MNKTLGAKNDSKIVTKTVKKLSSTGSCRTFRTYRQSIAGLKKAARENKFEVVF